MKKTCFKLIYQRIFSVLLCLTLSVGCVGILLCATTGQKDYVATSIIGAATYEEDIPSIGVLDTHAQGNKTSKLYVYPGGIPFGVKIYMEGLLVSGFSDIDVESGTDSPAYDAGIRTNDILRKINGNVIHSISDLVDTVEKSNGQQVTVEYTHNGKSCVAAFAPAFSVSEKKYKTGMWVKDSTSGIGTVTYVIPDTNEFAGLGHGICDGDTGALIQMSRGIITEATITGAEKGLPGTPGELRGYFSSSKKGAVIANTNRGIFGVMTSLPAALPEGLIEIGNKKEITEGEAYIWSTIGEGRPQKFSIEIYDIDRSAKDGKCFSVRVTDEALIEKTGGIVQGMSGSPIIQNGKLVGAVTHVLISDPMQGYGIFIENMLDVVN